MQNGMMVKTLKTKKVHLTQGRFQSYLFRDFSIARIKMETSPSIFEYDQ